MGMFMNNAGGAWDNAKKSFEKGVEINGEVFYKKSEPHKASVTGDTVGDPFKDTSGPSMNILIKLMSIVSLVIAPTLAQISGTGHGHAATEGQRIEIDQKIVTEGGAKQYTNEVQVAIDAIKAAGLVKEGESYEIDFADGVLKINDSVVPQSTLDSLQFNKDIRFEVEMDVEKKEGVENEEKEVKVKVDVKVDGQ